MTAKDLIMEDKGSWRIQRISREAWHAQPGRLSLSETHGGKVAPLSRTAALETQKGFMVILLVC